MSNIGKMLQYSRLKMIRHESSTHEEKCRDQLGVCPGQMIAFERWARGSKTYLLPTTGQIMAVTGSWNGPNGLVAELMVAPLTTSSRLGKTIDVYVTRKKGTLTRVLYASETFNILSA